jgi:hypothetical protein
MSSVLVRWIPSRCEGLRRPLPYVAMSLQKESVMSLLLLKYMHTKEFYTLNRNHILIAFLLTHPMLKVHFAHLRRDVVARAGVV